MSPFTIYLSVPEYMAQWYAHECAEHHFMAEDIEPRSLDPMSPVEPIRGSQESMLLEMYLRKQPKAVPDPIPADATLCIGIPYFKGKSPYTYNYLSKKWLAHLKHLISNRFKLQLWDEVHTMETLVGRQDETITLWMENHGIAFSDKNWNAVAKIYQRMRGVYKKRGTHV